MKSKVTAHIKGINSYNNKPFETTVKFEMTKGGFDYGTGYFMIVKHPESMEYVDVRYEGTTDIVTLATRYINGYYSNVTEMVIE